MKIQTCREVSKKTRTPTSKTQQTKQANVNYTLSENTFRTIKHTEETIPDTKTKIQLTLILYVEYI